MIWYTSILKVKLFYSEPQVNSHLRTKLVTTCWLAGLLLHISGQGKWICIIQRMILDRENQYIHSKPCPNATFAQQTLYELPGSEPWPQWWEIVSKHTNYNQSHFYIVIKWMKDTNTSRRNLHSISMKYRENNAHLYLTANVMEYGLFTVCFW
jgi:hypothetical protein